MQWQGVEAARMPSRSLWLLIEGDIDSSWKERGLGWEAYGMDAFRLGDWKIIRMPEPYGNEIWQLYHFGDDPGENSGLAGRY